MKRHTIDLTRTLVQTAHLIIEAATVEEAQAIVRRIIARGEDPVEVLQGTWSEGEIEGAIDVD